MTKLLNTKPNQDKRRCRGNETSASQRRGNTVKRVFRNRLEADLSDSKVQERALGPTRRSQAGHQGGSTMTRETTTVPEKEEKKQRKTQNKRLTRRQSARKRNKKSRTRTVQDRGSSRRRSTCSPKWACS